MRKLLCFSLLFSARPASAIVRATIKQQAEIIDYIEKASHALRNKRNQNALRTKIELERAMGLRDADDKLIRVPTEEDLKKLKGFWSDRRAEYAENTRVVQESQRMAHEYYTKAIEKTKEYYHLQPNPASGVVQSGHPAFFGKFMEWKPVFSWSPEKELQPKPPEPFEVEPAFIRKDGTIIIRGSAFFNKDGEADAGLLASYLAHEMKHMGLFLKPGLDLRNDPDIDRNLRIAVIKAEGTFELKQKDFKRLLLDVAGYDYLAEQWRLRMAQGYDPYLQPNEFMRALPTAKREEIERELERDMKNFVLMNAAVHIDRGEDQEALEYLRTHAESDFLKTMRDDDIIDVIKGYSKMLDIKTHQKKKREDLTLARFDLEAERCGFSLNIENGNYKGFNDSKSRSIIYEHRKRGNKSMDVMKVSFLFARACQAESWESDFGTPCNDGLEVINHRWEDSSLHDMINLWGYGDIVACVDYLRENVQVPVDAAKFRKLVVDGRRYGHKKYPSHAPNLNPENPNPGGAENYPGNNDGNTGGKMGKNTGEPRMPRIEDPFPH